MRTVSGLLQTALAREDLNLCRLFELTVKSGGIYRYTDLSSDLVVGGFNYRSDAGITVSAIRNSLNATVGNASVDLGLLPDSITEEMVRYGDIDTATFKLSVVDYKNPINGVMEIFSGTVAEVSAADRYRVTLEVEGYSTSALQIGEIYSQRCRNVFGDKRCKVDKEAAAVEFAVLSVEIGGAEFRISAETETGIVRPGVSGTGTITLGPGLHSYIVPVADVLTVSISSGSGSGGESGWFLTQPNGYRIEPGMTGGNGQNSAFGGYIEAIGGLGGIGGGNNLPNNTRYPGGGGPVGGGPVGGIGHPNTLMPYNAFQGDTTGVQGEPGNLITQSFIVNTPGSPQVGDEIEVGVGYGGLPQGHLIGPAGFSVYGEPGLPGYVTITWSINQAISANEYNLGSIVWIKGKNAGQISEVTANDEGLISLANPTSFTIQVGDRGRFRPGCSNYADMCEIRYNNLRNMQAEPAVPRGTASGLPSPTLNKIADKDKPFDNTNISLVSSGSDVPAGG